MRWVLKWGGSRAREERSGMGCARDIYMVWCLSECKVAASRP